MKNIRCAITGATGFIGGSLAHYFSSNQAKLFCLSRKKPPIFSPLSVWEPFTLQKGVCPDFFNKNKINVLIHCSYDSSARSWEEIFNINVLGSIKLLRQAKAEGVKKIIFISTLSAFNGCRSLYGKGKLLVEEEAFKLGATVIRPGLVYDDLNQKGLIGELSRQVRNASWIPLIGNGQQLLYPTHLDDLVHVVCGICSNHLASPPSPVLAASEIGVEFFQILKKLSRSHARNIIFFPIPWRLPWIVLRALEVMGFRPKFRSDSILSLVSQSLNPDFTATRKLHYNFRPLTL